jgi:hypothetical protein
MSHNGFNPSHDLDPTLRMNLLDTEGAGYHIADLWANGQCATIQELLDEAIVALAVACVPRRALSKAWEWAGAAMDEAQTIASEQYEIEFPTGVVDVFLMRAGLKTAERLVEICRCGNLATLGMNRDLGQQHDQAVREAME